MHENAPMAEGALHEGRSSWYAVNGADISAKISQLWSLISKDVFTMALRDAASESRHECSL